MRWAPPALEPQPPTPDGTEDDLDPGWWWWDTGEQYGEGTRWKVLEAGGMSDQAGVRRRRPFYDRLRVTV